MKGIIVLNLGTPDSPEPKDVGRYLKQFLMDKWVVDIAWFWRWILVNILIVPRRKYASGEAYHKIWTERGSPLRFHLEDLITKLRAHFPIDIPIVGAMRYGNPSIVSALNQLKESGVDEIIVFQLYPQYAESSVRSSEEETLLQLKELNYEAKVSFVSSYYEDPGFIRAYAEVIAPVLREKKPDHLLLSFHGVPERHVKRTDPTKNHCLQNKDCCHQMSEANALCYRAQCFATARALAKELNLKTSDYSVSFQSRLGRTPWIQPFTDFRYPEIAKASQKKLAVACPSFATDCLETIEEIGIRGKEAFSEAGGEELYAIPCLNSNDTWVEAVACMIKQKL
jgi:ferrochelatase